MAADLTQSFINKHFEKLILAAAVLVFGGAIAWFVGMRQPQAGLRETTARAVETLKQRSQAPTLDDALTKDERVALGIDEPEITAAQFEAELNQPAGPWTAVAKMVEPLYPKKGPIGPDVGPKVVTAPEKIMPVEDVQVTWGRGVTADPVTRTLAKLDAKGGALNDVVWVGCAGRVDLTAQLAEYVKGNAERQDIIISKVQMRRREMKPDGSWADWAEVPTATAAAIAPKMPKFPADTQDKRAVGAWYMDLKKLQAEVRRTPFHALVAIDPKSHTVDSLYGSPAGAEQPSLLPPAPAAGPKPPAPPPPAEGEAAPGEGEASAAPAPGTPPPPPPPPPPGGTLPGVPSWLENVRPPDTTTVGPTEEAPELQHVYATVWANDETVEPGKTYQYQMRVAVFNPVYSLAAVKDETQRWALEFTSDWGEPSEAITIPGIVDFFFVGTFGDKVNLELHRWIAGQWVMVPSAPSVVGAPVVFSKPRTKIVVPGGKEEVFVDVDLSPQVVLVDVMKGFPYQVGGGNRAIQTNVLVYTDAYGNLLRRIEWEDRNRSTQAREERKDLLPVTPTKAPPKPPPPKTPPKTPPRKR